eukprot:scaffold148_cov341-Pavlova_lutheri.AAC.22
MADVEDPSHAKDGDAAMQEPEGSETPDSSKKNRVMEERKYRDIFWLILFIAVWCGMVAIGIVGATRGEPRALLYGLDYRGNFCGTNNGLDLSSFKYRYWMNPKQLQAIQAERGTASLLDVLGDGKSICLQDCPSVNMSATASDEQQWICNYPDQYGGVNSTGFEFSNLTLQDWADRNYDYFDLLDDEQINSSFALRGPCYPLFFKTTDQFYSCQPFGDPNEELVLRFNENATALGQEEFCTPGPDCESLANSVSKLIYDGITNGFVMFTRYLADIWTAWAVLLVAGVVIPLILSILWIIIMRYSIGIFAWVILIGVNAFNIGITLFFFVKAGYIGSSPVYSGSSTGELPGDLTATGTNESVLLGFGIVAAVVTVLFLILTLLMIRRVRIAVNVIKVATQSLNQHPLLLSWPLVPFFMFIVLAAFWLAFGIYLVSSGDVEQEKLPEDGGSCVIIPEFASNPNCNPDEQCQCGYTYVFDKGLVYLIIYYFFGFLWTSQFIIAVSLFVIASTVAMFYWAGGDRSNQPKGPIRLSFKRSLTYHAGSLALGSLIVALVVFVRMLLRYMERRMKAWKTSNPASRWLICCVDCCLWLVQKFVEFTNRNAYIVVAVDGVSYIRAAFRALRIIVGNVLRVAAVNIIGDTFLLIGKVAITAFSGFVAFLMLQNSSYTQGSNQVSSPLLPVIAVLLGAFAIASIFMAVVEMAIDTIMLSYCMDCEENGGTASCAPKLLLDSLEEAEKDAAEREGKVGSQDQGFSASA